MRTIAAIPAAGLLAGAAAGLYVSTESPALAGPVSTWGPPLGGPTGALVLGVAFAFAAYWLRDGARGFSRASAWSAFVPSIVLGFAAGGFLLSASAWQRAWRPPLRVAFEQIAREQRHQAEAEGRRLPEDDEAFAIVEGVLRSDAEPGDNGVSLTLDVDTIGVARPFQGREAGLKAPPYIRPLGGVTVTVAGSLAAAQLDAWRAGRRVRLPATLHRPSRYLDPGVPDHERALARRAISLVGTVKSGALVDVLARASRLDEAFGAGRAFARRAIAASVSRWNPQSGAIVAAIVIGDRAGLDDRVQRRLQEAGTYHVIAISGGNIAILAGLLLGLFRVGGWLGRAAMLSAIVALVAYARFVGGGASVDRATLMAVVHFGARAIDQRSPPLNTVAVVAALLVAGDPLTVADPAFVLTFGATLAILLVVPSSLILSPSKDAPDDHAHGSWFDRFTTSGASRAFLALFIASLAAEVMLFPVSAFVFSRVTFAGLVLNFLAIPLMAVAQVAGMTLVPVAVVSPTLASAIGWVAHVGAAGLVWSGDLVRFAPLISYRVAPPAVLALVGYYAALAAWWFLRRRRIEIVGSAESVGAKRVRPAAAGVAAAAAIWILVDPPTLIARFGDGRLHVTFVDVGQGDAIFVVFPHGSTLLVDAGGVSSSFDIGDRVVAPVIRDAGFARLDYVAVSHGDPDHIGGAPSILEEFRPHEVWEGIPVPRNEALAALREQTHTRGARWMNVYTGTRRIVDEVEVIARHPEVEDWERQKVRNDDSLVLELRWRDVSILLTGDIGRVPERVLIHSLPTSPLRVVKIPHHGSLTSSSEGFVQTAQPKLAVVSAGRNNHYGHPVPEVLARYEASGAEVFRTDRDGAVFVHTDGHSLDISTFSGRHAMR